MVAQLIMGGGATALTGLVVILVSLHPAARTPGCSLAGCGLAILVAGLLPFLLGVGLATDKDWLVALAIAPFVPIIVVLVVVAIAEEPDIILYL